METTKNPYLRTHISIIKALLDGSKKTQNQIAKETNYEKSTISHALDYLENKKKVIIREPIKKESGYTNKGNYNNKLCWLTYEVDNGTHVLEFLREILKKDTSFITDLQKSDKIINLVSSNIKEETYSDFLYGGEENTKISDFIPDMFRYSVTFLKMFLTNDSYISSFYRIFYLLHCREEFFKVYSEEDFMQDSKFNNFDCFEVLDIDTDRIFFEAFNHSVINDFINGYINPEALKLIETLRENEFNRSDYETTQIEIETDDSTKIIRGS